MITPPYRVLVIFLGPGAGRGSLGWDPRPAALTGRITAEAWIGGCNGARQAATAPRRVERSRWLAQGRIGKHPVLPRRLRSVQALGRRKLKPRLLLGRDHSARLVEDLVGITGRSLPRQFLNPL